MIPLPLPERVEEFKDHLGLLSFAPAPLRFPSSFLPSSFFVSSDNALPTTTGPDNDVIGTKKDPIGKYFYEVL